MATDTVTCCDFCAARITDGERHARLSVPIVASPEQRRRGDREVRTVFGQMFGAILSDSLSERHYDVCVDCCAGLLRLSEMHRAALLREVR